MKKFSLSVISIKRNSGWSTGQNNVFSNILWYFYNRNRLKLQLVTLLLCFLYVPFMANAQFSNVPVTGYNADVVAEGTGGPATNFTTSDVDGVNYVFVSTTFNPAGTGACATGTTAMPANNSITSITTPGLTYSLQPYTGNNVLRLPLGVQGTLTLTTPTTAANLYLLALGGSGLCNITATVNFTDLTTQTITATVADWCSGVSPATGSFYRIINTSTTCNGGTCQYLYDVNLALLPANYFKTVASISLVTTAPSGVLNVFAVGAKSPCAIPTAQPTALTAGTVTSGSIAASFTAATTVPTGGYLVVRYPQGATTTAPVNGTTYTAGQALGTGTVLSSALTTSFTTSGLASNTAYDFYVYSYNAGTACGGPVYFATTPLTSTISTLSCGIASGTIQIGTGLPNTIGGGFSSISNALAALNTNGLSGNVILELQTSYDGSPTNETYPILVPYNACASATKTITIRPATNVSFPLIIGSDSLQTINMNGSNYVTFDGRPGGIGTSGQLTITNTKSTGTGVTIQFINDAHHNAFRYCDIQGQNTSATSTAACAVIYFGGTNTLALAGNDLNTIANCNIHATSTGFPAIAICSYGLTTAAPTVNWNDSNTITGCNIYDFYSAAQPTAAIKLDGGSHAFTISNNKIYQTAVRNYTTSNQHRVFWLTPTATGACGFQVINNYIGGDNATGTGVWSLTSAASILTNFWAMDINHTGLGRTSVQGNTITNISLASSTSTANDLFRGISTGSTGNVDIGNITKNTIGSGTATGAILISSTATGSTSYGIKIASTVDTVNVYNNTVGGITLSSATAANALTFHGIGVVAGGAYVNVVGNTVGSLTTPLSINAIDSATNTQSLHGISVSSGIYVNILNNKIANLNNNYKTNSIGYTRGIYLTTSTTSVISGNTVSNISTASTYTSSGTTAALVGIQMSSLNPSTVTNNIVDSLILTSPSIGVASYIEGIVFSSNGSIPTNLVTRNFVHSFDVLAANTSATMIGIEIVGGANIIANNMIRLGVKPDGSDMNTAMIIRGLYINTTTPENIYHNSVYIGGTGVGTNAVNTAAFYRNASAAGNQHDVRNNIFVNERSNGSTGGKHYQMYLNSTTALTLGNNCYYGTGTGSVFGTLNGGTADVAGYTQGWLTSDLGSSASNPRFINTTGSASAVNLHINASLPTPIEATGVLISSITDDYDGQTRSTLSPVDMGADAGNFTALSMSIDSTVVDQNTNVIPRGASNQYIVRIRMYAKENYSPLQLTSFALSTLGSTAASNITNAKVFSTGTNPNFSTATQYGSTVASPNGAFSVTGTTTLNAGINYFWVTYDISSSAVLNNVVDVRLTNIVLSGSASPAILNGDPAGNRTIKVPLAGPYNVGSSGPYFTIASAMTDLSALGVSAPVIFNLTDPTYTLTDSVFIGTIPGASSTNTVTLRPSATNTSGATITSSSTVSTFELSGTTYFIFDGRPGGLTSPITVPNLTNLNIVNTSISGTAIRFNNDSRFNTVKYCDLQGRNNVNATLQGTSAGVVYFGLTNGVNGNDNNTIDNCNIHSTVTTDTLTMGIYSSGPGSSSDIVGTFNDSNTVSNCNIYNMYGAINLSTGGIVLDRGNNAWKITGNSFFSNVTRTQTINAAVVNRSIYIATTNTNGVGNGFTITGNYFGGTEPLCGGTPYTSNPSGAFNNLHESIYLSTNGGTATNIKGNTFTNMSISQGASAQDLYHAVWVNHNGNVNIGGPLPADGNTIGSTTANGAITLNSAGGITPSHMILFSNNGGANASTNVLVQNNKIGGITMVGSGNSFTAIFAGTAATYTIDNNLIGSLTIPNSITATNSGTVAQFVRGINVPTSGSILTITNNTIANLSNNTTSTTLGSNGVSGSIPQTAGIYLLGNSTIGPVVTGNIVKDLSCAGAGTGVGTGAVVLGIGIYNVTAISPAIVSNNKVDSIVSTSTGTAAISAIGIVYTGPTAVTNTVAKNYVDNVDVSSANTNVLVKGLEILGGSVNVINNMVRLGVHADGSQLTNSLAIAGILKSSTGNNKFYNNSVYIGGTGVGSTAKNSAAFQRTSTGLDELRNNIFVNNRSNATTGGKHYQVMLNAPATIVVNNNIYYGNGTGAVFATANGTVDTALYKAGWISGDLNSIVGDPQFNSPASASALVDLHINTSTPTPVEASGVAIALVTDDYDGQARSTNTPTDIGADAGNFLLADLVGPAIGVINATNTSSTANRTISINITDNTGVATGGSAPQIFYYKSSGGIATGYFQSTATLASGTAKNGVWNFTIVSANLGNLQLGDSVYYYVVAQDISSGAYFSSSPAGASNSGFTAPPTLFSYKIVNGYSGNINVGTGQTFTSLTAVGGIFDSINKGSLSGDVTLTITSDLLTEDGSVALTQWAESGVGNYKVTIVPNAATERLIVGSVSIAGSGLIRFDGADRVKVDGRFGGSGRYLRFRNRAQTGTTFMFINDAQRDTITYCNIEGTNNTSGIISFATTSLTTGTGNDFNGVNNCNIGDTLGSVALSNRPSSIISSIGTVNFENSDNSIVNNNMYNFTGNGINIGTNNGSNWNIIGNSLYNNMQVPSAIGQAVIQVTPGLLSANNKITGNYIGGGAPLCGGAAYVITGNMSWRAISVNIAVSDTTYIQDNTIQNINLTGIGAGTFGAIENLGGVTSITGNTIGHNTTANSIQTPLLGNIYPILINASTASSRIDNNLIANITSTGNSTAVNVNCIRVASANTIPVLNIRNNTIKNISTASTLVSTFTPAVTGIVTTYAGVQQNISGNTISGLVCSGAAGVSVLGIDISASTAAGVIAANKVSGLMYTSTNNTAQVAGIHLDFCYNFTVVNNFVALGSVGDSSAIISGIVDKAGSTINNIFYNSVLISGTAASASATVSQAYRRTGTSGTVVKNNIFNNTRTGGTANYAIANTSSAPGTGWVANNNVFSAANPNQIGIWLFTPSTLAGWKSNSLYDSNSVSFAVNFISNTDLHVTTGTIGNTIMAGKAIAGYTTDIDGATRSANFPYIGADENSVPVPVKLVQFTASTSNNSDVVVAWRTASEMNNSGFEVLRSIDGKHFDVIRFVAGRGTTSLVTNYTIEDAKAFDETQVNTLYYMLNQIDRDGKSTTSNVVSVERNTKQNNTLVVSPNPFVTDMTVSLEAPAQDQATVQVVDIQGKVVARFTANIQKGFNTIHMDEMGGLNSGVYFVKLTTSHSTYVSKVVKQ